MDAIHVDDVAKTYRSGLRRDEVRALDGMSLRVAPGEIFGLLGPNGAGKTTLVKILLSVVRPTSGRAALFGVPVSDPSARRRIGFLPENHRFPGFLTAGQMLDLYGRMAGVPADERRTRAAELLERTGMARWRDTRIRKFSKGMMQRVGLAQALLNRPDLVFLDEPTDGVDPVGRREIKELLLWLRDEGTTVFLNSHLLSEVEQVCTRVAILDRGRLVREGTVAELTTQARAYELVTTPVPEALRAELTGVLAPAPADTGDGLERHRAAVDRTDLNALLDRLRGAGVEIEAVRPHRRSLEDYFVEVVSTPAAEAAAPAPQPDAAP